MKNIKLLTICLLMDFGICLVWGQSIRTPTGSLQCPICRQLVGNENSFNAHMCSVHHQGCGGYTGPSPQQQAYNINETGRQALRAKDFDRAAKLFAQAYALSREAVFQKNMRLVDVLRAADEAWQNGNWKEAIKYYREAAALFPNDPAYLENIETARNNIATDLENERINEVNKLKDDARKAWRKHNWASAIFIYKHLAEKDPGNADAYLDNAAKARNNQLNDAGNAIAKQGSQAFDRKDWDSAINFYQQAADKNTANRFVYLDNVAIARHNKACEAAGVAFHACDFPEAMRLYCQAQALHSDQNSDATLRNNIKATLENFGRQFANGVPPRYANLTDPNRLPVGPCDKADALFKLRVEKTFADENNLIMNSRRDLSFGDLQSIKERSGFVFDEGRVTTPAPMPVVKEPTSGQLEEAISVAKAALVLPRSALERANAPQAVKDSTKLQQAATQADQASGSLNDALRERKRLFQLGPQASPQALAENSDALGKATYNVAIATTIATRAGGTWSAGFSVAGASDR